MKTRLCALLCVICSFGMVLAGCSAGKKPVSDTVKWINTTYAVLTAANKGDIGLVGGYKKNKASQILVEQLLEEWWEVTDRESADETLDWILDEGHRAVFAEDVATLKEMGILDLSPQETQDALNRLEPGERAYISTILDAYAAYGVHAIDAWDYSRAEQLLGYYAVAGYYTEEEALDRSLEVAKTLQQQFPSWDAMVQSYLFGYRYWQQDDITDADSASAQRLKVYESLLSSGDNPYTLDWNLELTKTW